MCNLFGRTHACVSVPAAACRDCQIFNAIWDPTCLLDAPLPATGSGTKAATATLTRPWTYGNPCYAVCEGKATVGSAFYKGRCNATCDAKCSTVGLEGLI